MKNTEQYIDDLNIVASSPQNQYIPSQTVSDANAQLADVAAGKPAEYTNQHADALGGLYEQILNRGQFNWNMAADQSYQAYRQQYRQMGQQGMQQSMQNINALGGGYGNTFGGAVAAQQYGEQLKGMNDVLPAMEQNAYGAYQAEGARLSSQLSATAQKEQGEYERWASDYNNWFNERSYAQQRAQTEYANDYTRFGDNRNNIMQMIGWERQDNQTMQQNAYSWVMKLIQQGIMPDQTLIDQSGIDPTVLLKIARKHGYKGTGSGSGGSSGKGGTSGNGSGSAGKGGSSAGSTASTGSSPSGTNFDTSGIRRDMV